MSVRTLVVHIRDWSVLATGMSRDEPAAIVHANRIVACSPSARSAGVMVGQRRREAQGRCSALVVVDHDEMRDARLFEPVVAVIEGFSPRIEITRPGWCALLTRGPSRYFGGDQSLAEQVHDQVDVLLAAQGWPGAVQVGVADGPFAAGLAAGLAAGNGVQVISVNEQAAFLAPLPVSLLARGGLSDAAGLTDVLVRLGLPTLGALAAVPIADVVARFGHDGRMAHRLAAGLEEQPPDARILPPVWRVETEIDPPADRVDVVAFAAKTLADDLHDRLGREGLACTRVAILAETVHGESLERVWRHEGALSAGAIADRVRWQLDGWLTGLTALRPTSGISLLALVPEEVVAATGRQLGFWGQETAADERAARAFTRVQALLGVDAVTMPIKCGGRGPADQIIRAAVHSGDLPSHQLHHGDAQPAPWPGRLPAPWPAMVHGDPLPCEVVDNDHRAIEVSGRGLMSATPTQLSVRNGPWVTLLAWAGPWPVDERWWDSATHRRRARFQVVDAGGRAHLLSVEGQRWWVEATYD
ncbi:MAG: DNA polymerase Y family protein [Actinomycetes bacterium]